MRVPKNPISGGALAQPVNVPKLKPIKSQLPGMTKSVKPDNAVIRSGSTAKSRDLKKSISNRAEGALKPIKTSRGAFQIKE
jgi:hypothetical protein